MPKALPLSDDIVCIGYIIAYYSHIRQDLCISKQGREINISGGLSDVYKRYGRKDRIRQLGILAVERVLRSGAIRNN